MIQVRNNAVLTTPVSFTAASTIIPFDTIVLNTNSTLNLYNNAIQEGASGYYNTECTVVLQNAGAATVTVALTAYADGTAITGAFTEVSIPAVSFATITLPWNVKVINASSGIATISWYLSGGAVELTNATATVFKYT